MKPQAIPSAAACLLFLSAAASCHQKRERQFNKTPPITMRNSMSSFAWNILILEHGMVLEMHFEI